LCGLLALAGCDGEQESVPFLVAPEDTAPQGPIYPSGDRILMYYGNGGANAASSGWGSLVQIDEHWKEKYGWNTDWRDSLGDDLSAFRMIGFMAPGIHGGSDFTEDQIALLDGVRRAGTRLVVFNEVDNCDSRVIDSLLEGLGAAPRFTGEGTAEYQVVAPSYIGPDQITEGVSDLRLSDPCYIEPNGAPYIIHDEGNHILVKDPHAFGGEVVLMGDFEFLDDSGNIKLSDNLVLADRLVEVEPGLEVAR